MTLLYLLYYASSNSSSSSSPFSFPDRRGILCGHCSTSDWNQSSRQPGRTGSSIQEARGGVLGRERSSREQTRTDLAVGGRIQRGGLGRDRRLRIRRRRCGCLKKKLRRPVISLVDYYVYGLMEDQQEIGIRILFKTKLAIYSNKKKRRFETKKKNTSSAFWNHGRK